MPLAYILLSVCAMVGCTRDPAPEPNPGPDPHPALVFPGEDMGVAGRFSDVPEGEPFTFATLPVCVVGAETIEVTRVTPVDDRNISVVRFAVIETDGEFLGADYVPLEELVPDPSQRVVTRVCGGESSYIAVELLRTGDETGWIDAFDIHYGAGDADRWATVPVRVVLCSPDDTTTEGCH